MKKTRKSRALSTIIVISFVLTLLLFFADESKYSFAFLTWSRELGMLTFFTVAFSIIPLAIYGFMGDGDNSKSLNWALTGFSPPLLLLCWLLST